MSDPRYSLKSMVSPPGNADAAERFLGRGLERVIGPRAKKLATLGLSTVEDLLRYFPRRYEDPGVPTNLSSLRLGEYVAVMAQVASVTTRRVAAGNQWLVSVAVSDGVRVLTLAYFLKKPHLVEWYERQFTTGRMGLFTGTVKAYRGQLQLVHPKVTWVGQDPDSQDEAMILAERPTPIYSATAAVDSPRIQAAVQVVLADLGDAVLPDPIPPEVLRERHLMGLTQALHAIHVPTDDAAWRAAQDRFRFEEAFTVQVALVRRRAELDAFPAVARPLREGHDGVLARLDASLPFSLTGAQREVGAAISALVAQSHPMNELLQGDVGSGKTVVALRAMAQVVDAGGQAALLAPTEVLAAQHLQTIRKLLGPLSDTGEVEVRALTGSLSPAAKTQVLGDIEAGRADIVVGTHALLEQSVHFKDLGLVVVDEQHRFGVEQRDALRTGSQTPPHLLVMTATPIPRTVAMTSFGDLGVLTLGEAPPGRAPTSTVRVNPVTQPRWYARVWERVAEEVAAGHRAFVVVPAIEPGQTEEGAEFVDDADGQGVLGAFAFPQESGGPRSQGARRTALSSVAETLEMLRAKPELKGLRIAPMHGRLSAEEKDQVMAAFVRGDIDVLVATTVIEVGIDVPQATALVVLDADRFGLSQLHQLRGRVGRGADPGVALLVSDAEPGTTADTRLEAMATLTDGFALAEVDLETRHEGDILGAAQSGNRGALRFVRVTKDAGLIQDARGAAESVVAGDPDLSGHRALDRAVSRVVGEREDFLERG
jgi:ATP-dependent DNA helicase RecG